MPSKTVEERFYSKVARGDGCWEWIAAKCQLGYGKFWLEGQMREAHRVSYELTHGPVPDGLELDHLCRNTSCVNPEHLDPVSHRENCKRVPQPDVCPQGHTDFSINYRGHRFCRTCKVQEQRRRRSRQKGAQTC